jgi:hypothetical protein
MGKVTLEKICIVGKANEKLTKLYRANNDELILDYEKKIGAKTIIEIPLRPTAPDGEDKCFQEKNYVVVNINENGTAYFLICDEFATKKNIDIIINNYLSDVYTIFAGEMLSGKLAFGFNINVSEIIAKNF